ncbi:MFS transporter [Phenylobacterium sp.]|uniref:spinster family MFS transporter n=1 Tax=Phenylobacterium sp. TaxID=1871053 RepID=UPI002F3F5C16
MVLLQVRSADESSPASAEAPYPPPLYAYFLVGVIMVAYTFAFVDRLALSLVVDPIRHDLGLNDTQVGALAGTAFVVCFVLFSFPFGRWVDQHSRRNAMSVGVALWSLAMTFSGLANGFWPLFGSRMLIGVGEASINPAAYSIIGDTFPPHRRTFAMAIYSAGSPVGGGLGVFLGSLLLKWAETHRVTYPLLGKLAPWQVMFIGMGLPGMLVAAWLYLAVREPARRQVNASSKGAVPFKDVVAYFVEHRTMFALIFVGFAGFAINNYGFTVWGPSYFMRVHHLSVAQAGLLLGLGFGVFGTAGMLVGGLWSDRLIKAGRVEAPIWVALPIAGLAIPLFLAAYLSPWTAPAVVLFCCGMFVASMIGGVQGAMVQSLAPNRMRGQAAALYLTIANLIGLGVAPPLTAMLTDYVFGGRLGIGKALAVMTVLSMTLASTLIALGMKRARARAQAVQNS